jgi:hypothetical protein
VPYLWFLSGEDAGRIPHSHNHLDLVGRGRVEVKVTGDEDDEPSSTSPHVYRDGGEMWT